MAHFR